MLSCDIQVTELRSECKFTSSIIRKQDIVDKVHQTPREMVMSTYNFGLDDVMVFSLHLTNLVHNNKVRCL